MDARIEVSGVCLVTAKKERPFRLAIGRRHDFANAYSVVLDMELEGVPAARIFLTEHQVRQLTEALAGEVARFDAAKAENDRLFSLLAGVSANGGDDVA